MVNYLSFLKNGIFEREAECAISICVPFPLNCCSSPLFSLKNSEEIILTTALLSIQIDLFSGIKDDGLKKLKMAIVEKMGVMFACRELVESMEIVHAQEGIIQSITEIVRIVKDMKANKKIASFECHWSQNIQLEELPAIFFFDPEKFKEKKSFSNLTTEKEVSNLETIQGEDVYMEENILSKSENINFASEGEILYWNEFDFEILAHDFESFTVPEEAFHDIDDEWDLIYDFSSTEKC